MTLKRAESPLEYESDDTETVSLVDTLYSDEYDQTAEWELDRILAEGTEDVLQDDGTVVEEKRYLVKWSGYSVYRSTWQSEQDLIADAPETLRMWQEDKMRADRGFKELFDVNQWSYEIRERLAKRRRRHERRNDRRSKLGMPVVSYPESLYADPDASSDSDFSESEDEEEPMDIVESSSDDEPVVRKRQSVMEEISDDDEPLIKAKKKRRTAEQMERERQQTLDLLRRRKGTAILVNKANSNTKSTSRPTSRPTKIIPPVTKRKTNPVATQVTPSNAAANAPVLKRFEPSSSGRSWFGSLSKLQTDTIARSAIAGTQDSVTPVSGTSDLRTAPVAKMVGGPSRMAKKHVTTTGTSTIGHANFFAEKDKPAKVRKKVPTGQFNNLQHRHRALRAEQKDIAPSLEDVQLIDPATGKPILRSPRSKTIKVQKPVVPPVTPLVVHVPLDSPDGALASWNEFSRATQRSPVVEKALQSPSNPARPRAMSFSGAASTEDPQRTCYHYAKGWCHWQDRCPFPHSELNGRSMTLAEMKKQLTCWYWYQGRCSKTEEICEFAHSNKSFVASNSSAPPVRLVTPRPDTADGSSLPTRGLKLGPKDRWACWYWSFTHCRYSASDCNYTHGPCKYIAPNPRSPDGPILMATATGLKAKMDISQAADYAPMSAHDWKSSTFLNSEAPAETGPHHVSPSPSPRSQVPELKSQPGVLPLSFQYPLLRSASEVAQPVEAVNDTADIMNAKVCVYTGGQRAQPDLVVDVRLIGLTGTAKVTFLAELSKLESTLTVQHLCVAEMARAYLDLTTYRSLGAGQVLPSEQSFADLENLLEHLKLHSSGAVIFQDQFNMLLFPINLDTWKFLQPDSLPHKEAMLYFHILPPFPAPANVNTFTPRNTGNSRVKALSRSAASLDLERVFASTLKRMDKIAFLIFGNQYIGDMMHLTHCLHDIGMKVCHSTEAGTWERFCSQHKSGIILFHPTFYAFDRIPGLAAKLDDVLEFFQIGSSNPTPTVDISPSTYMFTRLFPHGRAVFISDACFSTSPRDTLEVIKALDTRVRRQGHGFTRILGRPNLLQWLYELAVTEHEQAQESVLIPLDNTRIELYTILAKLLADNPNYISAPPAPRRPTESSPLYFALESDLPGYGMIWDRNANEAEKLMAVWFNAWTMAHVKEFRKFMVVCPEHMAGIWKANNRLLEVLTPYQYMRQVGEYHKKNAELEKKAAQRKAEGR